MSDKRVDMGSPNIQWDPVAGTSQEQVQKGHLGKVTGVDTLEDRMVVKTEYGTLTFSGPDLEKCKGEFSVGDLVETQASVNELVGKAPLDIYAVMTLMTQTAIHGRQMAREARHVSRDVQMAKLKEEADLMRKAALFSLIGSVTSGALQIAGGFSSMGMDQVSGQATQQKWGGGATMAKGLFDWMAEGYKADAMEAHADATKAEYLAHDETEMMQAMMDSIKKVQEVLTAVIQSQNETMRHIFQA